MTRTHCQRCKGELTDWGLCRRCMEFACRVCGKPSGTPLISICVVCELAVGRGEAVDPLTAEAAADPPPAIAAAPADEQPEPGRLW